MKLSSPLLFALVLAALAPEAAPAPRPKAEGLTEALSRGWQAKTSDNICGLRELGQLSNPALVRFDELLAATAEMRKIRDEGIDPGSPEGIQLRQAAVDRVTRACERVRASHGHCSVWKSIRHSDGRSVPDLTDEVKGQL